MLQEQIIYYQDLTDKYIESLSTSNGHYVDIIVPISQNKIIVPNTTFILNTFNKFYKQEYKDESTFLRAIYSGKITSFNRHFKNIKSISLNPVILDKYKKNGINWIINEYLTKSKNNNFSFKEKIDYTVVFIMFTNNYYLYFNDYVPNYNFKLALDTFEIPKE